MHNIICMIILSVLKVQTNDKSLLWNNGVLTSFISFLRKIMKVYLHKPGIAIRRGKAG